jgi:hypothetical protein
MKLINLGKRTCIGIVVALALIAGFRPAYAQTQPKRFIDGNSAMPFPPSAVSCMLVNWGGIMNTCSSPISVIIPLPHDTGTGSGARTITMTAIAQSPSANVGCNAVATDKALVSVVNSNWFYVGQFGSAQPITLPLSYVWFDGPMYVQCDIGSYGTVVMASYPP